jgi:hypothetical protein
VVSRERKTLFRPSNPLAKAKGKRELKCNPDFINSKFKIVFWLKKIGVF